MSISTSLRQLPAQLILQENFHKYGQVIFPSLNEKPYNIDDAQLVLNHGIPRLHIMRLLNKGRKFHHITRHVKCTQCLGSLADKEWLIALAPHNHTDKPILEDIVAFRIPGNCFIKLNVGTWHSGPYIDDEFADFYNLELSDTNINDHETVNFLKMYNLEFEIV